MNATAIDVLRTKMSANWDDHRRRKDELLKAVAPAPQMVSDFLSDALQVIKTTTRHDDTQLVAQALRFHLDKGTITQDFEITSGGHTQRFSFRYMSQIVEYGKDRYNKNNLEAMFVQVVEAIEKAFAPKGQ